MGVATEIAWTDHTFNPWWGCERVSPGCQHCYAETFSKRTGHVVWGKNADRRRFGDKHWNEPVKWNRQAREAGVRRRVFCASMADVFEDRLDHEPDRDRLWRLIGTTPWLDWQLLTKRPENVADMVPVEWMLGDWPDHVWIGTTVEDQQRADERVPTLLTIPAPVRFLSCEPLLGSVDLISWAVGWNRAIDHSTRHPAHILSPYSDGMDRIECDSCDFDSARGIDWVICGGESGPGHRPLDLDHARHLRDQCTAARVPFFFKQIGGRTPKAGGHLLDGQTWQEFPRDERGAA